MPSPFVAVDFDLLVRRQRTLASFRGKLMHAIFVGLTEVDSKEVSGRLNRHSRLIGS
jgi:hypothetical protein